MISIIIPVYNRKTLVGQTLDSIQAQTFCDWECLLVDDHSTDGTLNVLQDYALRDSRFRVLTRPESLPKGPASCRNEGLRHANGSIIYFFDSDDLLDPRFFETFLPYLTQNPEWDYVNFRWHRFDKSKDNILRTAPAKPNDLSVIDAFVTNRLAVGTTSFLWQKSLLDRQTSLWNETLTIGEDQEFHFRLLLTARDGGSIAEPVFVYYRRNRFGLCFKQRFLPEKLARIFQGAELMTDFCLACDSVSDQTKKYLGRMMVRNMKISLKYGNFEYLRRFSGLANRLTLFEHDRQKAERYLTYKQLYRLYYHTLFCLDKMAYSSFILLRKLFLRPRA